MNKDYADELASMDTSNGETIDPDSDAGRYLAGDPGILKSTRRPSGAVKYRGERGGVSRALKSVGEDFGLSRRKAKRKLLRLVWEATSPGLKTLALARAGYPWDGSMSEKLGKRIRAEADKRPLTRNERRALRPLPVRKFDGTTEAGHTYTMDRETGTVTIDDGVKTGV